jgi:hypothetical protein
MIFYTKHKIMSYYWPLGNYICLFVCFGKLYLFVLSRGEIEGLIFSLFIIKGKLTQFRPEGTEHHCRGQGYGTRVQLSVYYKRENWKDTTKCYFLWYSTKHKIWFIDFWEIIYILVLSRGKIEGYNIQYIIMGKYSGKVITNCYFLKNILINFEV